MVGPDELGLELDARRVDAAAPALHAPHEAALERQGGAVAERDHQAALVQVLLQVRHAAPSDSARDVVGGVRNSWLGYSGVFA